MEVVAALWIMVALPALVLIPLARELGHSMWWGTLALFSYFGLIVGLAVLFLTGREPRPATVAPAPAPVPTLEPGDALVLARQAYLRGEIDAAELTRIASEAQGSGPAPDPTG